MTTLIAKWVFLVACVAELLSSESVEVFLVKFVILTASIILLCPLFSTKQSTDAVGVADSDPGSGSVQLVVKSEAPENREVQVDEVVNVDDESKGEPADEDQVVEVVVRCHEACCKRPTKEFVARMDDQPETSLPENSLGS